MKGKGNNIFQPEECVKRAEVAQVIFNMYGSNASVKNISYFSDVEMDEWYTNSINWCVSRRIINGFPDGTFKPEDFVTREDVLHLLYKSTSHETLLNYESLENFNDYNSISEYAKEAVTWSVSKGVVLGDDLNNINPGKYLTRAEFAAILSRVCSIQ